MAQSVRSQKTEQRRKKRAGDRVESVTEVLAEVKIPVDSMHYLLSDRARSQTVRGDYLPGQRIVATDGTRCCHATVQKSGKSWVLVNPSSEIVRKVGIEDM